jgi:hypothetical protein
VLEIERIFGWILDISGKYTFPPDIRKLENLLISITRAFCRRELVANGLL